MPPEPGNGEGRDQSGEEHADRCGTDSDTEAGEATGKGAARSFAKNQHHDQRVDPECDAMDADAGHGGGDRGRLDQPLDILACVSVDRKSSDYTSYLQVASMVIITC